MSSLAQKIKEFIKKETATESEWESYRTLACLQLLEPHKLDLLQSKASQLVGRVQLAGFRKAFFSDERSTIIDGMRPATLAEIDAQLQQAESELVAFEKDQGPFYERPTL
jgi:hypothetical protein